MDTFKHEKTCDEACKWIARLSNDDTDPQIHVQFADWLDSDEDNRRCYDEMERLWLDLGCVKYYNDEQPLPNEQFLPADTTQTQQQLAMISASSANDKPAEDSQPAKSSRFGGTVASIAVIGMMLVGVLSIAFNYQSSPVSEPIAYRTNIGQQQTITLEDRSVVTLNTNTRLSVSFTETSRNITLESGEAHFEVSKNPARPFLVSVPGATVKAVGTAFNIQVGMQETAVTVTEGKILVTELNNSAARAESTFATEKQRVTINPSEGLDKVELESLTDTLSWQDLKYIAKDTSLAEVVAQLNRYSSKKIKIGDPSIAYLPISGVLRLDQPLATLEGIEATLNLDSKHKDNLILLFKQAI